MRILLDQNLSASVADALRERGTDALHTRDVGLATAPDEVILEWCRNEDRVAFTRDADFHAILARSGESKPSVVRIRIEPLAERDLIEIIEWMVRQKSAELERGAAITVKRGSVRTHHLPLLAHGDERDE